MGFERNMAVIEAAEKAGIRIVIDTGQWFSDAKNLAKAEKEYPLNGEISPSRCDLVLEARRIADILSTRPDVAPEGVAYQHSAKALNEALTRMCKHIKKEMKDAEHAEDIEDGGEPGAESDEGDSEARGSESARTGPGESGDRHRGSDS